MSHRRGAGGHGHDDRARLDERDGAVLELAGRVALGVQVGELLQLERALERDREADVAAEEEEVAASR